MALYGVAMTVINIIAIVVSPLVALKLSVNMQKNNRKQNEKLHILKTLMTSRVVRNIDYVNALNIIDIVFVDSPKVLEAYRKLYKEYSNYGNQKSIETAQTKLLEAIISDVGYKDKITWGRIQEPYFPQWLYEEQKIKSEYMNAQKSIYALLNKNGKEK